MKYSFKKSFMLLSIFLAFVVNAFGVTPAYAAPIVVTSTADSGAGSLRDAIATAVDGDIITFDASLSGQTIVLSSTLTITENLTIDGSSLASQITISGDTNGVGDGDVRIFIVNAGATVVMNNLKIAKGLGSTIVTGFHTEGAGIFNAGTLTVTNSTFTGNAVSAPGEEEAGGAISNHGILTVTGTTFSGNHSTFLAGAIYNYTDATATVANSTFFGNSGSEGGGGIFNRGTLNLFNSTFSGNFTSGSNDGGGIYNWDASTLNYANNIIADSTSGGNCIKTVLATIGTNTNNLVEGGGCSASLIADPMLNALANNGGPSQTMSLQAGSPALAAGSITVCSAAPVNNLDQRGEARPQGNANCDLGAYESSILTATFVDVPTSHPFWRHIEAFYKAGITSGCSQTPRNYCPNSPVTRGEMAVFLERAMGNFSPNPNPTGMFTDVSQGNPFKSFIEEFYNDGITSGCTVTPLQYCPQNHVSRGQMAVFIERAMGNFSPNPNPSGMFEDVLPGNPFKSFIEEFYNDGITSGCTVTPLQYCPNSPVTRGQMAVFIVRAFGIPLP